MTCSHTVCLDPFSPALMTSCCSVGERREIWWWNSLKISGIISWLRCWLLDIMSGFDFWLLNKSVYTWKVLLLLSYLYISLSLLCSSNWLDLLVPRSRVATALRHAVACIIGPSLWNGLLPATFSMVLTGGPLFKILNLFPQGSCTGSTSDKVVLRVVLQKFMHTIQYICVYASYLYSMFLISQGHFMLPVTGPLAYWLLLRTVAGTKHSQYHVASTMQVMLIGCKKSKHSRSEQMNDLQRSWLKVMADGVDL